MNAFSSLGPLLIKLLACAALFVAAERADAQSGRLPRAGEWLQHRGDRALTGRCVVRGNITAPAVLWKQFTGVPETLLHVRFGGQASQLALPAFDLEPALFDAELARWTMLAAPDPDAEALPRVTGTALDKFLPDRAGLQQIQFDPAGFCKLMARDGGQWVEVWRSEKIDDVMTGLQTLTGDFDADGRREVVFTPWTHLHVLDLETGRSKGKARFYQDDGLGDGRPYGWFGAFDLDGDGQREFIMISDTQCYISVLGWKEGKLQFLWGQLFDTKTARASSELGVLVRPGVLPVQDVDGDARPEVVLSLVRELPAESGRLVEGKWSTLVLDGGTGRQKFELAGQRLDSLVDLDQDGAAELLCTQLGDHNGDAPYGVRVYKVRGDTLVREWALEAAAFQFQPLRRAPDYVHNGAANGLMTALLGPLEPGTRPVFFTRRVVDESKAQVELTAWRAGADGQVAAIGAVTAPGVEALGTQAESAEDQGLLVRVRRLDSAAATVSLDRGSARALAQRRVTIPPSVAVAARLTPGAEPTIIVQQPGERLAAWRVTRGTHAVQAVWNAPGRGMHEGSDHRAGGSLFTGVNLADLYGDERLAVIAGQRAPEGHARLAARDANGREIWHHDFEALDGGPPGFTLPGLAFWFVGRFTDRARDDVLVGVRNHTAMRLVLLDGRTGNELWSKLAGGMYMSVFDHDGDGLDDALTTCWSEIHVVHGKTGATLLNLKTSPPGIFGEKLWPADAYSCAADLLGLGNRQLLYWPSYAARALVGADGKLIWQQTDDRLFFGTPSIYPAIGDLDGDGRLELIAPGDHPTPEGHLCRCYDPASGVVRWSLPIAGQGRIGSAVTLDLDADGRDECLYTVANVLYAIAANEAGDAGVVRWQMSFPGELGPLSLADVEGSGHVQILVVCADGFLYGVGQAE